ncbi:MAG: DUF1501 domain-containing protein [Gemmataceae bacterium]|nr:DUF1501 domain-containing protein [Gemmataceae bacterium]
MNSLLHSSFDRRVLLRVGATGLFGLAGADLLAESRKPAKAKSVIMLYQWGGPGQHETFDPKPDAPAEVRGSFKTIETKVSGIRITEGIPQVAEIAEELCLVRCVQHTMKNHNSAGYYSLTGVAPSSDDQRLRDSLDLFPAPGSIVDKFIPSGKGVPSFVSYPYTISDGSITPGQHASFLGKSHNPFFFTQDPNSQDFRLPELALPSDVSSERMESRKEVLKIIDEQGGLLEQSALAKGIDDSFQKAVSMLTSPTFKKAFDLSKEPKKLRDRYGRTTYGQGCLLARRLVEAGAKWISVYFSSSIGGPTGGWDTHGFRDQPQDPILKNHLLPLTNQTLPTLISDLKEKGLLESTLVLWMGEFGRTPRINKLAGRDHWPQCYTVVMAGGGLKRGFVYGASDKIGAYPTLGQARPEDITATVFELMGLDPETEIRDKLDRPLPISRGRVISDIIA